MTDEAAPDQPMTIGQLSARTGVSVKALREYADVGLIYGLGRSPGNYRLFGEDALWCVEVIGDLRHLGLRVAEITAIATTCQSDPTRRAGPLVAAALAEVRTRTRARIDELFDLLARIDGFETENADVLEGHSSRDFRDHDPRRPRSEA